MTVAQKVFDAYLSAGYPYLEPQRRDDGAFPVVWVWNDTRAIIEVVGCAELDAQYTDALDFAKREAARMEREGEAETGTWARVATPGEPLRLEDGGWSIRTITFGGKRVDTDLTAGLRAIVQQAERALTATDEQARRLAVEAVLVEAQKLLRAEEAK